MHSNGTSGWSDETVESLFPNGQVVTFVTIELVQLPPRFTSYVQYDPTLGLGETVGDAWWETARVEQTGYVTLQEQQAARQFFISMATAPLVAVGCAATAALLCVPLVGMESLFTYTVSTESVGLQADPETAAIQAGLAMALTVASYAAPSAVNAAKTKIQSSYEARFGKAPATTASNTAAETAGGISNKMGSSSGSSGGSPKANNGRPQSDDLVIPPLDGPTKNMSAYSKVNHESGYFDVTGHGTPTNIMGYSPQEIAVKVRNHHNYSPGQDVRLLSCETGCPTGTFAQGLADELGVTVKAPMYPIASSGSGKTLTWFDALNNELPLALDDGSVWRWVKPNP
jgi:hypothetical protein